MPRQRKTEDEWNVQQFAAQGWEDVSAYKTWREAKECVREYRENQPEYPVRIVCRRVKLQPTEPAAT